MSEWQTGAFRLLPPVLLAAALVIALSGDLSAQTPAGPKPPETIFSLIMKGRWIMIPLGICSLITLTLAFERGISFRKARVGSPELVEEIFKVLPPRGRATKEQTAAAITLCDESKTILGRVLRTGVEKFHRDEAHTQAFLEEAAAREGHLLKRKVRAFNVISSLAPLLGLLGTISGMITCFEKATSADAAERVSTLTEGIYEALVATAAGLIIAIVALILYHYFLGVVDRVVDRMDEAASRFLEHYYGTPAAARTRAHAHARGDGGGETSGAAILEAEAGSP
ncbi:MAG TPA: MotA/TolQ/ExbB proton channel family protein [Planctomycetota bacterium]|nr:MotA/TolQ/ExbB proton channel family protein [Planctomycetota bacterium]